MRSCVPRSFPIAHSIDAIHHLAERPWLLCAYKRPIHQLHHPYNKTSWLPLQAVSSLFLAVITVSTGLQTLGTPRFPNQPGLCGSYPSARLHKFNLFTRASCCDSQPNSLWCSPQWRGRGERMHNIGRLIGSEQMQMQNVPREDLPWVCTFSLLFPEIIQEVSRKY